MNKNDRNEKEKVEPFGPGGVLHVTLPEMRIHMRRDGQNNIVWINGTYLLFLNKEAADITETFIAVSWEKAQNNAIFSQEIVENIVVDRLRKKYPKASTNLLREDFHKVFGTFQAIARGLCPVEDLGLGIQEIDPITWTAPARMDLAITYRCNNDCFFCYAGGPRGLKKSMEELSTAQWKKIIDLLWGIGIPQVVFTGGEPTNRKDLVELVNHAQKFVTGLITNGRKLSFLAEDLHQASLDYVQVSLESATPEIHDKMVGATGAWKETVKGIKKALKVGLNLGTNTTLTKENIKDFPKLIEFGHKLGLKYMACNSLLCSGRGHRAKQTNGLEISELKKTLIEAKKIAKKLCVDLQWYSPTCYLELDPRELGFGIKGCSAAHYNMTVEPDGSVIPCQSWIHQKLGNILEDSWVSIWGNPTCVALRKSEFAKKDEACQKCQHLEVCGGSCPLERLKLGCDDK